MIFLIEDRSKIKTGQLLHVAGFVAIFIQANYPTGVCSDAGFYRELGILSCCTFRFTLHQAYQQSLSFIVHSQQQK